MSNELLFEIDDDGTAHVWVENPDGDTVDATIPKAQLANWCREVLKRIDPVGEYEGKVAADVESRTHTKDGFCRMDAGHQSPTDKRVEELAAKVKVLEDRAFWSSEQIAEMDNRHDRAEECAGEQKDVVDQIVGVMNRNGIT